MERVPPIVVDVVWNAPTPMPAEGGPWIWIEDDLNWQPVELGE